MFERTREQDKILRNWKRRDGVFSNDIWVRLKVHEWFFHDTAPLKNWLIILINIRKRLRWSNYLHFQFFQRWFNVLKVLEAASDPAINQRHFARWCVRILHFHIAIYLPFYEYSLYITPSDEYIPLQLSIKLSNKLRGMTGWYERQ